MKCFMFGLACDDKTFNKYLEKNKNPYSVAHYVFETEFIKQLEKYYAIEHNYIYQEKNKNIKKARIKKQVSNITPSTQTRRISYVNLPIINYITMFFSTFISIIKYSKNNKDFFVLSTINYLPVALATLIASKCLNKKNVIVFTDCSIGNAYSYNGKNHVKNLLIKVLKRFVQYCENHYDGYILFSKCMEELVNKSKKPSCVMEGFINEKGLDLSKKTKYDDFIVLYGGSLLENLGLENLIEAIKNLQDVQLWIVGEGNIKERLKELAKNYNNIKFYGFMDREKLFNMEKKVNLLVNVRNPELAYTRYSFPSKTFEYLLSQTPFLSTRLACYNDEYEDYIYFIEDNEPKTIWNKIKEIKELDCKVREKFGKKAAEFVLEHKNSTVQCKRVVDFLNKEVLYEKK